MLYKFLLLPSDMKRNRKRFTSFSSVEAEKPDYFFRFFCLMCIKYIASLHSEKKHNVFCSVADPDSYVFVPPGSGSFYHPAKIVRKTLIPTVLTFYIWKTLVFSLSFCFWFYISLWIFSSLPFRVNFFVSYPLRFKSFVSFHWATVAVYDILLCLVQLSTPVSDVLAVPCLYALLLTDVLAIFRIHPVVGDQCYAVLGIRNTLLYSPYLVNIKYDYSSLQELRIIAS